VEIFAVTSGAWGSSNPQQARLCTHSLLLASFLRQFLKKVLQPTIFTYKSDRKAVGNITENLRKHNKNSFTTEIKLSVNHRLFEKGYITEEMYIKAKEMIIKS